VYRCIAALLDLHDAEAFGDALQALFGQATVDLATELLERRERFFGLSRLGPDFEGSALHAKLLRAHDKLGIGR
jgi:ribosomal protein S12 methylthiotransferase accessory factor